MHISLKALSTKSQTRHEFQTILSKKGFTEDIIAEVVDRLEHLKCIDDKEVAFHYAIMKAKRNLWGTQRIRHELRKRGVSERDIEESLDELRGEVDEKEILEKVVRKKLQWLKKMDDKEKIAKLYNHLIRKGFPQEDIMAKMKNLSGTSDHEIG